MPGAADALGARLIQAAGFEAAYATGSGIANALLGLPDLGLATMTEIVDQVRRMVAAIEIPLIADADNGYGNPLNVIRAVRELERAGVAAIQIEDQVSPKRCGHVAGKELVTRDEMVRKLGAALEARREALLIARTDAIAVEGLDAAIERAGAYAAAGAELIFVEAPTSRDELARIAREVEAPLVANMTEGGRTPLIERDELAALGFKVALYPDTLLRAGLLAGQIALAHLRAHGSTLAVLDRLLSWDERQRLVDLPGYQELARRFVVGED